MGAEHGRLGRELGIELLADEPGPRGVEGGVGQVEAGVLGDLLGRRLQDGLGDQQEVGQLEVVDGLMSRAQTLQGPVVLLDGVAQAQEERLVGPPAPDLRWSGSARPVGRRRMPSTVALRAASALRPRARSWRDFRRTPHVSLQQRDRIGGLAQRGQVGQVARPSPGPRWRRRRRPRSRRWRWRTAGAIGQGDAAR